MAKKFTDEQEERLREVYNPEDNAALRGSAVERLAIEFGKTKNAIIAKLSSAGMGAIYVKKAHATKTGAPVTKKDDIIADIVNLINEDVGDDVVTVEQVETLTKANKTALQALLSSVALMHDKTA